MGRADVLNVSETMLALLSFAALLQGVVVGRGGVLEGDKQGGGRC
jgi:hypothetical protein